VSLPLVVAVTGASGAPYAVRLVEALAAAGRAVDLVVSPAGARVLMEETGRTPESLAATETVRLLNFRDVGAPPATGSYRTAGMIVCPCSMGTLGRIAAGTAENLITRAADVALKEGRPLVLVPRETPLSAIHLENMLKLARLGVGIVPAMPGFYAGARTIEDLVEFQVARVLDRLGVEHAIRVEYKT